MKIYSINSYISRKNITAQSCRTRQTAVQNFGESIPIPVPVRKLEIPEDELAVYQNKTREELADELMWVKDIKTQELTGNYQGADGKGCKSIVTVAMPQDKYTKDELAKLAWFSEKATKQCFELFGYIEYTPLHLFCKLPDGKWFYERETENKVSLKFNTLDETLNAVRFSFSKK